MSKVFENSICGVRAFSEASRTCYVLAQRYLARRVDHKRVDFSELRPRDQETRVTCSVTLTTRNQYQTLQVKDIQKEDEARSKLATKQRFENIASVLQQNQYPHLEFLSLVEPKQDCIHSGIFNVISLFRSCLPSLTRLTIALPQLTSHYFRSPAEHQGTVRDRQIRQSLGRFSNLQHVEVHTAVSDPWQTLHLPLLRQREGCAAAEQFFHFLNAHKEAGSKPLVRLDLVVTVRAYTLFGAQSTQQLQVTMTCRRADSNLDIPRSTTTLPSPSPSPSIPLAEAAPTTTVLYSNHPIFDTVLDFRSHVEDEADRHTWRSRVGPCMWRCMRSEWPEPSPSALSFARAIMWCALTYHRNVTHRISKLRDRLLGSPWDGLKKHVRGLRGP